MTLRLFYFLFYLILFLITSSCNKKDDFKDLDCAAITCISGDVVNLIFLKNNLNILDSDPVPEIAVNQNNRLVNFNLNEADSSIVIFLTDDDQVTITIDDQKILLDIFSTFVENKCCSNIRIEELKIGNLSLCQDESCDELISINLN